MCKFEANFAFDKATNRQTDIKHEMWLTLSLMSLLKIEGEKLLPSQRLSLDINLQKLTPCGRGGQGRMNSGQSTGPTERCVGRAG